MRALLALALVACTHHQPAPVTEDLDEPVHKKTAEPDSKVPDATPPAPPPTCPVTQSRVSVGSACSGEQACEYPDAYCGCEKEGACTGSVTRWKQVQEHPTYAWSCTPKVRADGCPGLEPNRNWACPKDGQVCEYTECISRTFACRSGKWQLEKQGEPPP